MSLRPGGDSGAGGAAQARAWLLGGTSLAALASWIAMYGKLWAFERTEAHRFTAKALLTGTLRLRVALPEVRPDEQVYNGGGYTNWGFGVPILQAPFHAAASALRFATGFFPDRAIYFVYLASMIPVLASAAHALLAPRVPAGTGGERRAWLVAWSVAFVILARTLFPLMSTRFVIYESAIAYFIVFELLALSAYVFMRRSEGAGPACGLGAASGMALLIRPTGGLYAAVWGLLVLFERNWKRTLVFAASIAPFALFWLYSNQVRTGSPLGLGFINTNPGMDFDTPVHRFGAQCVDGPVHAAQAAARFLTGFFFFVAKEPSSDWFKQCHLDFEERDGVLPFFGPPVLALLGVMIWRLVVVRERRLARSMPYVAMAAMFASFVVRGQCFAWRYAGDFWPAILLACAQDVEARAGPVRWLDERFARWMFAYGAFVMLWFLVPWGWATRAQLALEPDVATMAERFDRSRWGHNDPIPSVVACGDLAPVPIHDGVVPETTLPRRDGHPGLFHDGLGWNPDCTTADFTNVYLGVPKKDGSDYELTWRTEGRGAAPAELPLYFNGRVYRAHKDGEAYRAIVPIDQPRLDAPIVMTTILWTHDGAAPPGRLLSVELR